MSAAQHKCIERIYGGGAFGGSHLCGKSAAHEHEGKHYCKLHHPPTVYAKREARNAKWDAQRDAERAVRSKVAAEAAEQKRRADLFPEMLSALEDALEFLQDWEDLSGGPAARKVRAAIAKALPVTTKDAA